MNNKQALTTSLRKIGFYYHRRFLSEYVFPMLVLMVVALSLPLAQAQTVTLTPSRPLNYWAGVNTANSLTTNIISVVELNGGVTTNIILSISGVDGATVFGTLTPSTFTNNGASVLALAVTNAANGFYPVTVSAGGDASYSTNINLFVVPQWLQTNVNSTGNWSNPAMWSGGAVPLSTDGVYINHSTVGPWTNVVDSSRTIQSLVYLGTADEGASISLALDTTIAPGQTLSVLGTNGFFIGNSSVSSTRPVYVFEGGTLLVSNALADFSIIASTGNSTRYLRANMSGLDNLLVYVNRMAIADILANKSGPDGASLVDFVLAKTNIIKATLTDNYNKAVFDTAVSYMREDTAANNGQSGNAQFRLGYATTFYADSVGIGIGDAVGSSGGGIGASFGYRMVFANPNSLSPTNYVVFRNTDGVSRMSLLALGVDQGLKTQVQNNRGVMDLRGGIVDMMVDQIWLGQDRTNSANMNGKDSLGGLYFDWGTIDCNTLIAGNMKYTNNIGGNGLGGYVLVGTNGTLIVNDNLILGNTPADVTGFEAQAALVTGQVRVDNGGTLRANQISVGRYSTNVVTINAGGTLDISNTIASADNKLSTLTAAGGGLTLHIHGTNTLVFASNLVASASSPINIASISDISTFPATISVISYNSATTPANWSGGTGPSGISVSVANNAGNNSIDVTLTTGAPKSLLWQGYDNNVWDSSTKNWLDLSTGIHTNFSTGDSVTFDDTASTGNINVAEDIVPSQTGTGIAITNNTLAYTFSGSGRILGGASVVKAGTNALEIDIYTEFSAQIQEGILTGTGTMGAITVSAGASAFLPSGATLTGGLICSGVATNAGTINAGITVRSGGAVTNSESGIINGIFTLRTNAVLNNSGTLNNVGSATVATNAVLINAGTIRGGTLTVDYSGTLIDTVPGNSGDDPGSINVTTLTINGTFIPGGDVIATTKVTDYTTDSAAGNPAGRVLLNTGSTTVFKVDLANSQPYTTLLSQNQAFGPSVTSKAFNGGTLFITNINSSMPFAVGQTFKLFGNYITDGDIFNAGLNTTNSYPVIIPSAPGDGLAWDLTQLIPKGIVGIIGVATNPTNIVFTPTYVTVTNSASTNIALLTQLSWPSDHIGWRLQQQQTVLTNGLGTNWVDVFGSVWTNNIFITNSITTNGNAGFFRMVYP